MKSEAEIRLRCLELVGTETGLATQMPLERRAQSLVDWVLQKDGKAATPTKRTVYLLELRKNAQHITVQISDRASYIGLGSNPGLYFENEIGAHELAKTLFKTDTYRIIPVEIEE